MEAIQELNTVVKSMKLFGYQDIQNLTDVFMIAVINFLVAGFQEIPEKHKVKGVSTTIKNAQSNGICERMHQTMLNVLKVYSKATFIDGYNQAYHLMKHAIAACIHATRVAVNHTMQHTPGVIIF